MITRLLLLTISLVFSLESAFAERSVELASLQKTNDRWFVAGETEPFSGTAMSHYDDGSAKAKIQYRDGLRHGKDTSWYPNGELRYVVRYKKGEIQSLGSTWYSKEKPKPAVRDFALCSEHPELISVCGEPDTDEVSSFEFCQDKRC